MIDGTQLILRDRLTPSDVTDTRGLDVTTTHTLDRDGPFDSFTSRAWGYPLPNTPDDELADMLDALERLHTFVAETERRHRRPVHTGQVRRDQRVFLGQLSHLDAPRQPWQLGSRAPTEWRHPGCVVAVCDGRAGERGPEAVFHPVPGLCGAAPSVRRAFP